ncbi:hypothetical protein O0I10_011564 [Lichtheimia ornata]|uniref:Uncharacterized protein n=1 Tax=Lichtheimia ornata TaxID=688661 RepID=A0AAD7XQC1_9FUNG|nr:uncharacterized protein O0I10_011564 [Lichtheimia ornata]KAJ8652759.1 hypothetical protein O0I10_011564 [Lichtheimia ornata]
MDTYSLASTKVSDQDLQRGLKRKRVLSIYGLKDKKSVRFDLEHCQVAYTYSSAEYDRGSLRRPLTLYRPNPALSLSIPPPHMPTLNNGDDSPASSASPETPPNASSFRIPPPKLSIDTSLCAGPLIFTNMSTTYIGDDDSTTEDFLVPLSV